MKTPAFTLALFGALSVPIFGTFAEENVAPDDPLPVVEPLLDLEPRIAVLPTEVSLNGIEHPALGRSLSDSLIGGLLAQGNAKVISYPEGEKEEGEAEGAAPEGGDPPEVLAGMLGKSLGAQKVLVPRLVGEDEFYRFTVKEVDAGNNEVLRVFELSHVGDREGIFGFVPLVLGELEKDGKAEKVRREPGRDRDPVIKIWSWEEFRRDFGEDGERLEKEVPQPQPELVERHREPLETREEVRKGIAPDATIDAEDARVRGRKVAEMVALGKVLSVNNQWGFCVIDMTGRKLKPSEEIEIREGKSDSVYATLVVTRVEGDKAIADLAEGQERKRLFPGDLVFGMEVR